MAKRKIPIEAMEQPYAATHYQEQMELAEASTKNSKDRLNCASYKMFVAFLYDGEEDVYPGPYFRPLSFRDPMTYAQYCKLLGEYSREDIFREVQAMQNYDEKSFWGKRVSFYLTIKDWLSKKRTRFQYQQPDKPAYASVPRKVEN